VEGKWHRWERERDGGRSSARGEREREKREREQKYQGEELE
jgi:hypothetical protein